MKDKLYASMQTFSRAIIRPVMFMAVTGIVISLAALFKLESMPAFLKTIGELLFTSLTDGTIGNIGVIICVGVATAISKKRKTDTAVLAISVYLIFLYANNYWLTHTGTLATPGEVGLFGTGQNIVLGIQVTDMGVFLGIILGTVTGYVSNKCADIKFHKYLSPYEGTKFAYLLLIIFTILFAILTTYIWPPVNIFVTKIVEAIAKAGPIGFFGYGFINRLLLPFGLHHLTWMPLSYTPLGGAAEIAGEMYYGAQNIWLAELSNLSQITEIHPSIGYLANFGYTALPLGIGLALIYSARKENRDEVKGLVYPALIVSFLAGITEPIEFLFLFTTPILWLAHAVVYGLGLLLASLFNLNIAVSNIIETTIHMIVVPMELGNQWLVPILFVLLTAIEFFVFYVMIKKLNLKTIGTVTEEGSTVEKITVKRDEGEVSSSEDLEKIISGLGGRENIALLTNCYSRLRFEVYDPELVDEALLKQYPSKGIIIRDRFIQIIIGFGVQDVRDELDLMI